MKWLEIQTSLFDCVMSNQGRICTIHEALVMCLLQKHRWFFYEGNKIIEGESIDHDSIDDLRHAALVDYERPMIKKTLQCWTPSGCFSNKSKDPSKRVMIHTNPIMQFDFDHLEDYDIDEAKEAIFSLPFICCVGLSCSGNGLFALALIEEPERLSEYAEYCFRAFEKDGIPVDTSKGRNHNDLRFVTVDRKMLFKQDPTPLKIPRFNAPKLASKPKPINYNSDKKGLVKWATDQILLAEIGQRFATVQKVSYTMGGCGIGLDEIIEAIHINPAFYGAESKYKKIAEDCYRDGRSKPLAA